MPYQSKAQSRMFHWAEAHPKEAAREGLKPAVVSKFIEAGHGQKVGQLPERVKKATGGAVYPAPFRW